MTDLTMTVVHPYAGQTVTPASGEAVQRGGRWIARITTSDNLVFCHPGPFASRMAALDFVNLTMREGATII